MKPVEARRLPFTPALLALLGLPLLALGLDIVLIPRLVPRYVRRVDVLADRIGVDRPPVGDGSVEVWGLLLLVGGAALVVWGLKELISPAVMVAADEQGLELRLVRGPWGGRTRVPWAEVRDVAPAVLSWHGDEEPALAVEVADRERLPERPWGALWAGELLVVRAAAWWPPVSHLAAEMQALAGLEHRGGYLVTGDDAGRLTVSPRMSDPLAVAAPRPAVGRRVRLGALLIAAAAIAALILLVRGDPGGAYLPALGVALVGVYLIMMALRDVREWRWRRSS